jgi:mRNA-degrading endonuclease RelE of RelBE toxin-antitoxin system
VRHRFHPEALDEWHEAAAHYFQAREDLADEFVEAVRSAITTVLESPSRWPAFTEHTRAYRLHKFPFRLVYTIEPDNLVFIASVMHTSRDATYVEQRLG